MLFLTVKVLFQAFLHNTPKLSICKLYAGQLQAQNMMCNGSSICGTKNGMEMPKMELAIPEKAVVQNNYC